MTNKRWVCPHDPQGNDPYTATYCPLKEWAEPLGGEGEPDVTDQGASARKDGGS